MHKNCLFFKFVNLRYQEMNGWKRRCCLRKELSINEDDSTCFRSLPAFFRKNHKALPFH